MNKNFKKMVSIIVACALFVTVAAASTKASYYLSSYGGSAHAGSFGQVIVALDVDGTGMMDVIGVSTLAIQVKESNGTWRTVSTFFASNCAELVKYNTGSYMHDFYYQGSIGKEYRAGITFYAEKNGGSDARTYTTNSVVTVM